MMLLKKLKISMTEFLLCKNGSHLAMYDDQQVYMSGLVAWLKKVEQSR
jgi:proline iminopeptidase